jgi:hypothetical protein
MVHHGPCQRVIARDDLGGRTDYRSCGCQLVDHVDPRPRLPGCRCAWPQLLPHRAPGALTAERATMHVGTRRYLGRSRCRGRIHIHLSSVQVRASSAATGCDAAAAIRLWPGLPEPKKLANRTECRLRRKATFGNERIQGAVSGGRGNPSPSSTAPSAVTRWPSSARFTCRQCGCLTNINGAGCVETFSLE